MKFPRSVYAIQHNETKRIYIGSSADVETRYWNHIQRLRNGKHNVEDMQNDFDEYGENYSLFILDEINDISDKHKEYDWMVRYRSFIRGKGYNYRDKAKKRLGHKGKVPLVVGLPKEVT